MIEILRKSSGFVLVFFFFLKRGWGGGCREKTMISKCQVGIYSKNKREFLISIKLFNALRSSVRATFFTFFE